MGEAGLGVVGAYYARPCAARRSEILDFFPPGGKPRGYVSQGG